MQVPISSAIESRYQSLAERTGRPAEELMREAVETFVDYEERLIHAVETTHAEYDLDEFTEHEQLKEWIETRFRH
jgi:predicted transcriptional regulator